MLNLRIIAIYFIPLAWVFPLMEGVASGVFGALELILSTCVSRANLGVFK